MSLPELQQNPLVQRVIDIFDTDGNGEVDFKGERTSRPRPGLTLRSCKSRLVWLSINLFVFFINLPIIFFD